MMPYRFTALFILIISFMAIAAPSSARMTSSSYSIATSVISGGGGRMNSSSYELVGTLGQPSPLGVTTGADFELKSGFWESATRLVMRQVGLPPAIYLLLLGE